MAKNTMADLDPVAANNSDVLGQNTLGTANANALDDVDRAVLALLARFYQDTGGLGTVAGSANAITLTSVSTYQTLETGIQVAFKAASANTTAATFALDGLTAKAIRRKGDTALSANDIIANGRYLLQYDAAYNSAAGAWVLLNPEPPAAVPTSNATAAEIWAGTATKPITVDQWQAALVEQTLVDGATVTVDFAAGINFKLDTIGGNRTLAASNLTNVVGRTGVIRVKQDGTGSRTLNTSGSTWVNVNGQDIVLSTAASAEDEIYYRVKSSTKVLLSLGRAIA